ncbi:uncharacterized protein TRIADDRAFT_61360 [Trichoplax adhaerens]|uniref:Major facilitator superfamily (MFS) profile domain-containing protein n=1 Tax=Trichoplax adhaerens TaxID=10228 RepID=B3SAS2_TRIAD|nr:hypothetical protein TRIADDRAFT_61360 [Trichoplax adhaerens]EDV20152.1 hypothetical protein TRIADDRAFT_61360 [Trichoplax adhaerens]|eukprot:XP_002117313.1 hypothetical protein TRIADDRAFT_61360 [Trichoplax adhaerens]
MSSKSVGAKPTDRYNIIYIVFIILGTASTLPVHIFYTASSYYKAKLKGTRYEHVIENYLMLAYSLPTLFMGVINLMLLRSFDVRKRLAFSVIMLIIFFTATAILAKLDTTKWKMTFFILSLTIISLNSVFGSTIYQGSLFGLASIFPKEYAQALITGQALAGVFTAIVNILSLIASHSASHSGVAYFICGIILLLVSLIIQLLLKKNAFARYYMELNLEYDTYQRKKLLSHEDEFSETDEEHERVPNEDSRIYRIKHIINKLSILSPVDG